jgi:hypothetical protein
MKGLKIIAGLGAAVILTACGSSAGSAGQASTASGSATGGATANGGTGTGTGTGNGGGVDGSNSGGTPAGAGHKVKKGTISGVLTMVGGAIGAGSQQSVPRPVPGTVTFTSLRHGTFTVQVGSSGQFSMKLPVGSYHLTGRSPRVMSGGTETPCIRPAAVNVGVDGNVHVAVNCIVP